MKNTDGWTSPDKLPRIDFVAQNLLTNPSFEDGHYATPYGNCPNGWAIEVLSDIWPEIQVPSKWTLPPEEQGLFCPDGERFVKLFKGGHGFRAELSQAVNIPASGDYVLELYVVRDVWIWEGGKVPPDNPDAALVYVLIDGVQLGSYHRGPYLIGDRMRWILTLPAGEHWLTVGFWAKLDGYSNNFFLDDWSLSSRTAPPPPPPPPPSRFPLGIHVQRNAEGVEAVLEAGPRYVVLMDGALGLVDACHSDTRVIGVRVMPGNADAQVLYEQFPHSGGEAAEHYVQTMTSLWAEHPAIRWWAGVPNEPPSTDWWSSSQQRLVPRHEWFVWLNNFEARRTKLMYDQGLRTLVLNWACGHPTNPSDWINFTGCLAAASKWGSALGVHEYYACRSSWLYDCDQVEPDTCIGPKGWHMLRYRWLTRGPVGKNYPLPEIVVNECGADYVQPSPPGCESGPWRAVGTEQDYIDNLMWYADRLAEDGVAGCVFTAGGYDPAPWNIDGTAVIAWLAEMLTINTADVYNE